MCAYVIVPITVDNEVLNAIVTDHCYYPETPRVEILAGYMAEPGQDFYKLMKRKDLRSEVKAAIMATYDSI